MREPKCCCCGVRLGLCIMYALFLIGGSVDIAKGSTYVDLGFKSEGAIYIIQGIVFIVASMVGFLSIKTQKVKTANTAMWTFVALITVAIILSIISLSMMGTTINQTIDQEKSNPSSTDATIKALKATTTTALVAGGIVVIGLTLIFGGIVVQRMYLYKKWLVSREKIDSSSVGTQ
eukprot:NODE_621_length_5335_cov_0.249618.p3 type:complete len:176 gc:universal NODE_621_length_5335_cov_0.249618:1948-1421(-)